MALGTEEKTKEEKAPEKRPYRSPKLRRLGTVADLTLGGGGSNTDSHTSKMGN